VRHRHLVAHVAGLMQVDDAVQVGVRESLQSIAREPALTGETHEVKVVDQVLQRALRKDRCAALARGGDLAVQGCGDDLQV
jgi:hypothetical protein